MNSTNITCSTNFPTNLKLIVIDEIEYNSLKKENIDLKLKILELSSNEKILQETIKGNEMTINELRKENDELKQRICILEKMINDQGKIINKLLENKEFSKFKKAIQDLNDEYKLETKVTNPTMLEDLREDRVDECHYLNKKWTNVEKNYRIYTLGEKIKNMSANVMLKFDNIYPGLINDILPYTQVQYNIIPQRIVDKTNNWWDE